MLGLLRIGKTLNKIVTSDNYLHGTWKRNKEIETKEKEVGETEKFTLIGIKGPKQKN